MSYPKPKPKCEAVINGSGVNCTYDLGVMGSPNFGCPYKKDNGCKYENLKKLFVPDDEPYKWYNLERN
jgi:hypothetical protein